MEDTNSDKAALLNMMQDFDRGIDVDVKYAPKAEPAAENQGKAPEQPRVEEKPAEAKAEEAKPSEQTPPDSSLKKDSEAKQSEAKPKSKWAANEERKAKTWEQINAEKEALKAEKEALAREREEVQKRSVKVEKYRDERGFSAEDYRNAAKQFKAAGDAENMKLAEAAEQRAVELEQQESQLKAKAQQEEFSKQWAAKYQELATKNPALKDQNSEEYKATLAILNEFPLLTQHPNGLEYAYKAVQLNKAARDSEVKESKIKELTQQLESLQKKLAIGAGVPAEQPREAKSFEDMTLAEQRKYMEQAAKKADRDAGWVV